MLPRLSISFFAISGLDVLGRLDLLDNHRTEYIDWIYQMQIVSCSDEPGNMKRCGFRGSLAATTSLYRETKTSNPVKNSGSPSHHPLDTSHITMTYAAINSLLILGDDLQRLQKEAILAGVKALQLENGR